jgi:CheY-like chemotaxis protein
MTTTGTKILLVEDEAIELLSHRAYDAMLLDTELSGISGMEVTRRIREGSAATLWPEMPIIALTGSAMARDSERRACPHSRSSSLARGELPEGGS